MEPNNKIKFAGPAAQSMLNLQSLVLCWCFSVDVFSLDVLAFDILYVDVYPVDVFSVHVFAVNVMSVC